MSRHTGKFFTIFFVLVFLFSIFSRAILADRLILSATLNGSVVVTVSPGASITANINVATDALNDKNWRSTSWNISGATCVNHADHNGTGTYSETFTVTAPTTPGTYDISFIAYADSGCLSAPSPTYTLVGGVIVSGPPTPTPTPGPSPTPTPTSAPGTPTPTPTTSSSSGSSSSTVFYPTVSLNAHTPDPTNRPQLSYTGSSSVENGTIKIVEYTTDNGVSWIPALPSDGAFNTNQENFSFITLPLAEGIHTIKVRAVSQANVTTQEGSYATDTVTIATTPPTITLDKISPNPTMNQTPTISGIFSTKIAPIARVDVSLDGGKTWFPAKRSATRFSLVTKKLEDGNYQIRARAIDTASNTGFSDTQTLIVDTLPPIVGGGMISMGPMILSPDQNGMVFLPTNTQAVIALSMKGGVTKASIATDSESFELSSKEGSNIWLGKIKFSQKGEKLLTVLASDGADNFTKRQFTTISVAPSGLVSDKATNQAVEGATISIYVYETLTGQWTLWDAGSYGQQNLQKTDEGGSFVFLVPPGRYYLQVTAPGYQTTQSEIIAVSKATIIGQMIPLTPKPKIDLTLPFFGKIVLSLPSFTPPETFTLTALASKPTPPHPLIGELAPDFSLPNLENKNITPSQFQGKKLLLVFISPWSSPSLEQALALSLAEEELDEDQAILAISLQETVSTTKTLMSLGNYHFPILADSDGLTAEKYHVSLLPHLVFVDTSGKIQALMPGVLTKDELLTKLSKMQ